jgi:hypothetical protein
MVLNEDDPTIVDEFSFVAQGKLQLQEAGTPPAVTVIDPGVGFRNPDNLDAANDSLMVQEDTSNAKIWRFDYDATWTHVASVTHPTAPAAGESSGIVDLSQWLGDGWWALDVQSHVNQLLDPTPREYVTPITGVVIPYQARREDGQLLLMYIPGS